MSTKTKIKTIGWLLLSVCCVILLVAAVKAKDAKACRTVSIVINGAEKYMFVKRIDILQVLNNNNIMAGKTLQEIDLKETETQLEQNAWIKDAELYFDNRQTLHVQVNEREPVARVFTANGNSFYIDSNGLRLPVSGNATARLTVFTSFPSDKKILSKPDSLVLNDVKVIANNIAANRFLNEQTAQVNITTQRTYEITPVIGNQVIRIGNADSLQKKFDKLFAFYKQVWSKGFERYSVIDVQYEGQVVAVRKGEGYTVPDTARAMRQLAKADNKLSTVLNDTTYAAPLSKPVNVDGAPLVTAIPVKDLQHKKEIKKTRKPAVKKNTVKI